MRKSYILAASSVALFLLAGCGSKESYDCESKQTKEGLKAAIEERIITDMIQSRGFRFADKKVFDNADTDKMREIYAEIKAEYAKMSIDIRSIKAKSSSETLKTSECSADISINGMEPQKLDFSVKSLSEDKVEVNIKKK